jgi:hypothetical protein
MAFNYTPLEYFQILPILLKLNGLHPFLTLTGKRRYKASKLVIFNFVMSVAAFCMLLALYLDTSRVDIGYKDMYSTVSEQVMRLGFGCQVYSAFLIATIRCKKYAKFTAKLNRVDADLVRLNFSTGHWKKRLLGFEAVCIGFCTIHYLLNFRTYWLVSKNFDTELNGREIFQNIWLSSIMIMGNLHFWLLVFSVKMRFDALRKVLKRIK